MAAELMTPAEFGNRIDKSADWVLRNYKGIPHRRLGRSIRFTEQDLSDYLESRRVTPKPMRSQTKRTSRK